VEVSATFQSVKGTIGVGVRPVRCALSISPATATFGPFGGAGSVQVLVSAPACRWSARSDAPWLPLVFDPPTAGSGTFGYSAPANSTTAPRTANIVVTTSTGESALHAVTVNRTTGCSYVTDPEDAVFTAAGGTGQFRVITTPNDCRWNLVNGMQSLGVQVTSGFSGTGAGQVRYSVQAHTRDVDADGYLEIAGLSGDNPNGRHHIVLRKR
jgi:trimeric autotransporter adhesin